MGLAHFGHIGDRSNPTFMHHLTHSSSDCVTRITSSYEKSSSPDMSYMSGWLLGAAAGASTRAGIIYTSAQTNARADNVLKSSLTESNKVCRLNWAIKHVTDIDGAKYFNPMNDTSKRHQLKVMLLSAVARPRWYEAKGEWFTGKMGTWHFTEVVPEQRSSCRHDAGTPVMKTVKVTRNTYNAMIIDNVIPAIRSKWPNDETKRVKIQ
ncbi:hypothetical protein H257_02898 [Aphanomyces astaci]|uniref:Uncharacterized protein n=1 Tax=Aphanomyces astaci TaxID=112090 RepID=W4GZ39_APHAT|nr:hypothetical protein H257_02898 [Aphanomyces astaci]ETV85005.1 hypothetical protein H257_02898 [Aphanomyces astaci]|eukprot:XP_009825023.1 hypothetical protein H257_02898 [Aphanomyces astaci]